MCHNVFPYLRLINIYLIKLYEILKALSNRYVKYIKCHNLWHIDQAYFYTPILSLWVCILKLGIITIIKRSSDSVTLAKLLILLVFTRVLLRNNNDNNVNNVFYSLIANHSQKNS